MNALQFNLGELRTELLEYLDGIETDDEDVAPMERARKLGVAVSAITKTKADSKEKGLASRLSTLNAAELAEVNQCFAATKKDIRRLLGVMVQNESQGKGTNATQNISDSGPATDSISLVTYNASRSLHNGRVLRESMTKDLLPLKSLKNKGQDIPGFPKNGQAIQSMSLAQINAMLLEFGLQPQDTVEKARLLLLKAIARW